MRRSRRGAAACASRNEVEALAKVERDRMTPQQVLEELRKGNGRFRAGSSPARDYRHQQRSSAAGQFPAAVTLGCVDSRAPAEIIFDVGIGDMFSARVAGNVVNDDLLGSLEFACAVAGAKLVLLYGHTACGAIKGAIDDVEMGSLTGLLARIKPAISQRRSREIEQERGLCRRRGANQCLLGLKNIRRRSPILADWRRSRRFSGRRDVTWARAQLSFSIRTRDAPFCFLLPAVERAGCLLPGSSRLLSPARGLASATPPASRTECLSPTDTRHRRGGTKVQELEEEVGDRDRRTQDPALFRRPPVARRLVSSDRVRLRFMRVWSAAAFAVSFLEPLVQTRRRPRPRGSGDAEVQFNASVVHRTRFRAGASLQTALHTSSDALLGPGTATLKPSLEFAGVLTSRLELTAAFSYKRSIHASRGIAIKQFEPDVILNARVLHATWFLEWDSFYDYVPGRLAQTLKPGVSRAFGPGRRWVGAAYYAFGVNDYARRSQYRRDVGIDVTWFPLKDS
jgi:carbonic anhydrase